MKYIQVYFFWEKSDNELGYALLSTIFDKKC